MTLSQSTASQNTGTRSANTTPSNSQQKITDIYGNNGTTARRHHATTRANDDPRKKTLEDMLEDPNCRTIKDATQAYKYLRSQGLATADDPQNYQIQDIAKVLLQISYFPASDIKAISNGIRSVALMLITLESTITDLLANGAAPDQHHQVINNTDDIIKRLEAAAEMTKVGTESVARTLNEAKEVSDKINTQNIQMENMAKTLADDLKRTLEDAAESLVQNIRKASTEANETVTTASKAISEATSELNTAKRTYSQAVRSPSSATPRSTSKYTSPLIEDEEERRIRDKAQRGVLNRQILINPIPQTQRDGDGNDAPAGTSFAEVSLEGLKTKANEALSKMARASEIGGSTTDDIKFVSVKKLSNGGLVLEINNDEAASLLKNEEIRREFLKHFDPTDRSTIKEREYQIIAFGVPVHFEPENAGAWRDVEATNTRLDTDSIVKARWVKPPRRRSPGQQRANVIFHFKNPSSANYAILKGLYICGRNITCERIKKEPLRCMKCQLYDHLAHSCTAQDTCSQCGENHESRQCTNKDKTHCVACNDSSHSSWDRTCPSFLEKCDKLNGRLLENSRPFFPIDEEPWTLVNIPPDTPRHERTWAIRRKIEEMDTSEKSRQFTIEDAFARAEERGSQRQKEQNNNAQQPVTGTDDVAMSFGWGLRREGSTPPITHSPTVRFADINA